MRKKSYQFPIRSIEYCLNHFGIKIEQADRFIVGYMSERLDNQKRLSCNIRQLLQGRIEKANP